MTSSKSLSISIPTGILVFAIIWRVLSSKGEFSNNPSFPVNLSINRSGLTIRVVKPSIFPSNVPSKIDCPKPTNNKSYSPWFAESIISASISLVTLKTLTMFWFKRWDSSTTGTNILRSWSFISNECISVLNDKCIAVTIELSPCFLTKLFAIFNSFLPLSGVANDNKILYLLLFPISCGTTVSLSLNINPIKSKAGPVIKVVTRAIITIIVKISVDKTPRS